MKKDLWNFSLIILISLLSIYGLGLLLSKYYFLTFEHFTKICSEVASKFLSSGPHDIGLSLTTVAILGVVSFFIKSLFSIIKTHLEVSKILSHKINSRIKVLEDRLIVVHAKTDLAFTIGWLNPKIIISDHLVSKLNKKELEAVILHETHHLKRRHPILLATSEIISASLFFIPILRDLARNLKIVLEKEADDFVIRKQKGDTYLNLALEKVSTRNNFKIFPTLSKRNDFRIKRSSIISSFIVTAVFVLLFLLPTRAHADSKLSAPSSKCAQNQCSVNCP